MKNTIYILIASLFILTSCKKEVKAEAPFEKISFVDYKFTEGISKKNLHIIRVIEIEKDYHVKHIERESVAEDYKIYDEELDYRWKPTINALVDKVPDDSVFYRDEDVIYCGIPPTYRAIVIKYKGGRKSVHLSRDEMWEDYDLKKYLEESKYPREMEFVENQDSLQNIVDDYSCVFVKHINIQLPLIRFTPPTITK